MEAAGASDLAARPLPRAVAIVPARLASTRLPRKMLLRDTGRYLFEHTVRNVQATGVFERVVLATDAEEIRSAAEEVGIAAVATSPDHPSGTDRVREAHALLRGAGHGPWDVVVNVQGDEPELAPRALADLVAALADPAVDVATLHAPVADGAEAEDPDVVKVVVDREGDALYFSRARIPWTSGESHTAAPLCRRHVGVYAFRPPALERFCALPRGGLELAERLEQLRWLEAGGRMRCVAAARHPAGIDTPEHYAAFRARLAGTSPTGASP